MIENSNEKIIQIDTRINAKAKVLYIWKHWENYVLAYKKIPATNIHLERLLIYQSASKYLHISKYLLEYYIVFWQYFVMVLEIFDEICMHTAAIPYIGNI